MLVDRLQIVHEECVNYKLVRSVFQVEVENILQQSSVCEL